MVGEALKKIRRCGMIIACHSADLFFAAAYNPGMCLLGFSVVWQEKIVRSLYEYYQYRAYK